MKTVWGRPQPLAWLALAPHPDDAEIGLGGTLIRLAQSGQAVGVLELTRGEGGTLGDPDTREAECLAAAEIMNLSWRGQLGLPDGGLGDLPDQARALASALRLVRPRVLAVPHPRDRHPDHFGSYHLAKRALHLAALAKADVPGPPHRTATLLLYQGNAPIEPTLLVDVEAVQDRWEAAVRAHASQFSGPHVSETVTPEVVERRRARLGYWGSFVGKKYCEAFQAESPLLVAPEGL